MPGPIIFIELNRKTNEPDKVIPGLSAYETGQQITALESAANSMGLLVNIMAQLIEPPAEEEEAASDGDGSAEPSTG